MHQKAKHDLNFIFICIYQWKIQPSDENILYRNIQKEHYATHPEVTIRTLSFFFYSFQFLLRRVEEEFFVVSEKISLFGEMLLLPRL